MFGSIKHMYVLLGLCLGIFVFDMDGQAPSSRIRSGAREYRSKQTASGGRRSRSTRRDVDLELTEKKLVRQEDEESVSQFQKAIGILTQNEAGELWALAVKENEKLYRNPFASEQKLSNLYSALQSTDKAMRLIFYYTNDFSGLDQVDPNVEKKAFWENEASRWSSAKNMWEAYIPKFATTFAFDSTKKIRYYRAKRFIRICANMEDAMKMLNEDPSSDDAIELIKKAGSLFANIVFNYVDEKGKTEKNTADKDPLMQQVSERGVLIINNFINKLNQ